MTLLEMMDQESGGAAGRRVVPTCVYMPATPSASIPLPTPLDVRGDVAGRWKRFKVMWSNYEIASQLNTQANKLMSCTSGTRSTGVTKHRVRGLTRI